MDQFEFKRLVLKATPRVGDAQESRENSFWRKFKVSPARLVNCTPRVILSVGACI